MVELIRLCQYYVLFGQLLTYKASSCFAPCGMEKKTKNKFQTYIFLFINSFYDKRDESEK